jgi:CheY-like chemotaxis protein
MVTKLLDEEHIQSGQFEIHMCGDECAIEERANEGLSSIVPAAVGETMTGEAMAGEAMTGETLVGETTPGVACVEAGCWGGPETILLVEDEGFVRRVTAEVLESAGYKLVIARSGAEALDAYRQLSKPVDLLLADVVMPGMSGCDLAAEFESLCPGARVLLMSGYAGQLAWCQVSPYGKTYLAKPFSVQMLLKRVREVLDTNPDDWGALA